MRAAAAAAPPSSRGRRPLAAWFALVVVEGLALGIAFDSEALAALPSGWWTFLLRAAGTLMPLSAAVGAAVILVCWARPGTFGFRFRGGARAWLDVALQLACFAGLFGLTSLLFADPPVTRNVGWLVAAWLAAVAATAFTWLRIGLVMRNVPDILGRHGKLLALALGLGVAGYAVGRMAQALWLPLRQATFAAVSLLLRAVADDPIIDADAFLLGEGDFVIEVAPECSGYEGVGLSWVFLGASLWLFRSRLRFPRAFVLLAIGTVAPWLANVVRLAVLILVGSRFSADLAAGAFHSYAGAILFCLVALGTIAFALRWPWLTVEPADGPTTNPAAPYLVPFLAMVAAGLVSRALATGESQPLGWLRLAAGAAALALFLGSYRALAVRPSWFALPAGVLAAGLWLALDAIGGGGAPAEPAAPAASVAGAASLAMRAFVAIVLVPVAEELAFRGFFARRLSGHDFDLVPGQRITVLAVLVSSAAFGLLHQRMLAGLLAGVVYALVYRKSGKLVDAVIAHAATNATLVAIAAATGRLDLWL